MHMHKIHSYQHNKEKLNSYSLAVIISAVGPEGCIRVRVHAYTHTICCKDLTIRSYGSWLQQPLWACWFCICCWSLRSAGQAVRKEKRGMKRQRKRGEATIHVKQTGHVAALTPGLDGLGVPQGKRCILLGDKHKAWEGRSRGGRGGRASSAPGQWPRQRMGDTLWAAKVRLQIRLPLGRVRKGFQDVAEPA